MLNYMYMSIEKGKSQYKKMKPDRNVSNTSFSSSDEQIPDEDLFTSSKRYDTVIFIVCVPPFIIYMYAFLYLCLCLHPHVHINHTNINTVTCTQRLNRKTDTVQNLTKSQRFGIFKITSSDGEITGFHFRFGRLTV